VTKPTGRMTARSPFRRFLCRKRATSTDCSFKSGNELNQQSAGRWATTAQVACVGAL
jgi:hypothetical protein